ncbi:uncharacterized protein Z518_02324 [Rhinocladiella mackenziei CBS 650.93]|uniref:Uncharacterized protein n=1 Tax=Rhinocladiella mackenziei CBS 650.93 TaxID=1442369 RepID=A0A0D2JEP9_9EURO|nr:uncharacterized protein Z518_02324 [Rhinocladiella mackenziei CBS 650.93]KIX07670.1 hypothetical protein Z518_02324 [Rhinocladiella mackenziei CBS 650.93]
MEPIETHIEYIVDDPRFLKERPFAVNISPASKIDGTLHTVNWVPQRTVIHDIRLLKGVTLDQYGFQNFQYVFTPLPKEQLTHSDVVRYQIETEQFLKQALNVERVICFDCRFRKNGPPINVGEVIDVNNPLHFDLPPRGAHSKSCRLVLQSHIEKITDDITFEGGPFLIKKIINTIGEPQLLHRKYRYRIVNTWRPLVERLDDNPLAFCDFRTVDKDDLLASDQIYAQLRTELYYLKYNKNQKWYWLSHQTPEEVMVMVMYDTKAGSGARFCPHVSFENPQADSQAPPRESVETRSIVLSLNSADDC